MDEVGDILQRLDEGELGDPLPVLAFLGGREVDVSAEALNGARRRAMLLLAAGGDPQRELAVDDPAVKSLAADLFSEERRASLAAGIDELAVRARDLPRVREAALFLAGDVDLAWRLYALALVADELG